MSAKYQKQTFWRKSVADRNRVSFNPSIAMRVFVAGGTGVVGKYLMPLLVKDGHEVVALARTTQKAKAVERVGAKVAYADALNEEELIAAIKKAEPEVIIHQLTALAGVGNFKKLDQEFALTNRFRTEVINTMLAAARAV